MAEKKVAKTGKKAEVVEKQTAITVILLIALGAFLGLIIGYILFRTTLV